MVSVVDRYVYAEWLKVFVMALGSMFGLLILFEIQNELTDLVSYDASADQILFYYAIVTPSFLTITLPAAILVSILYSLGQLNRSNEFLAMRSAGLSVFRVTRTIWLSCLLLSGLLWYLNSSLIPWSHEKGEELMTALRFEKQAQELDSDEVGLVLALAFDNRKENRMWFINRYSAYKSQAYGISVSIMDEQRRELRRIMARYGYYDELEGHWKLFDGKEGIFDPDTGSQRWPPFERMDAVELDDDPRLMQLFERRPKDLSFLQLKLITDNFTEEDNPKVLAYKARLHGLMAGAASCLIVAGIAIPFAVSGVRSNPAVGVGKSVGLFFAFYFLTSVLNSMGRQGSLPPQWAAWTPIAIMIALSYALLRRTR